MLVQGYEGILSAGTRECLCRQLTLVVEHDFFDLYIVNAFGFRNFAGRLVAILYSRDAGNRIVTLL